MDSSSSENGRLLAHDGPVRMVLVGCGKMGKNHLRVLRENSQVDLVAVVDSRPFAELEPRAALQGVRCVRAIEELDPSEIDAFVVSTPTETHFDVSMKLLDFKKPMLIEKPLASSAEEAAVLLKESLDRGIYLGVGHVERHNPAVKKLFDVLNSGWIGDPIHCSITRVGGYPGNVEQGNNVLLDLAVHDLDVLELLVGGMQVRSSFAHSTLKPNILDTAEIICVSESGVSASIHVNWITPTKIRGLRFTGTRGVCFVDYILQTCTLMGGNLLKAIPQELNSFEDFVEHYRNSDKVEFSVQKEEPLKAQLVQFLRALRGQPNTMCSAKDGAAVVKLAEEAFAQAQRLTRKPTVLVGGRAA